MNQIREVMTILFVKDQAASSAFYQKILRRDPESETPGMSVYKLLNNCSLGLMPSENIVKVLDNAIVNPDQAQGVPRCELYMYVDNVDIEIENALENNAVLISPLQARSWGDTTVYFADPDGHLFAFAQKTASN